MPVYVDDSIWPFRRMMMCHMIADSMFELLSMADTIGVNRKWIQGDSFTHFDLCKAKRAKAVKAGAIECDRKTYVGHMNRIREEHKTGFSTNAEDY